MADEIIPADDLIIVMANAAAKFAPHEAAEFEAVARHMLSAFRTDREARSQREEGPVIPNRYRGRESQFIVFDAFVRSFIDPIQIGSETLELLSELDPEHKPSALGFLHPEEPSTRMETLGIPTRQRLVTDLLELQNMATTIGAEVFGSHFLPSDFWGEG
jgi:hypothetical protein